MPDDDRPDDRTPLPQRREVGRNENAVLRRLDVFAQLDDECLPARIGGKLRTPLRAVVEVGVTPHMNHVAEGADLDLKVADQVAEDRLLDRQSLVADELEVSSDPSRPDLVSALLDNHG